MVCLLAKRYDTKSNIKLGGFRSQLQASYVSSLTEGLRYNQTVCVWQYIYIYIYIYIFFFFFFFFSIEFFLKQNTENVPTDYFKIKMPQIIKTIKLKLNCLLKLNCPHQW